MIHYNLSNRQRKELDRGAQLRLAIPIDPEWRDDDWPAPKRRWVVDRLPELAGDSIARVTTQDVWVDTWLRPGVGDTPSTRWGEIVDRDQIDGRDVVAVRCVVVTARDTDRPRTRYPTRWPGGPMTTDRGMDE